MILILLASELSVLCIEGYRFFFFFVFFIALTGWLMGSFAASYAKRQEKTSRIHMNHHPTVYLYS